MENAGNVDASSGRSRLIGGDIRKSSVPVAGFAGNDGTNELLVSDVIRTNEMQVWFLSEHLVDVPLPRSNGRE